jgi:methylated-DNA-[protein]-cysteine S-methyltransferase
VSTTTIRRSTACIQPMTTARTVGTVRTHTTIDSPVGTLTLVNADGVLCGLYMQVHSHRPDPAGFGDASDSGFDQAVEELSEYFAGGRTRFDLPIAASGTTFEHRVWALLREIPHGETRTYGQLAERLGDRGLARAVGTANGRNPISIIVPCHRVIGADGSLTGYAGGLARKQFLLSLEDPSRAVQHSLFES